MISPAEEVAGAPSLRREVTLDPGHGEVVSAWLHASSLGVFEAFVDGVPAGPDVLSPGWSSYEWRLRYRSYDVTSLLSATSVLGFSLGNGWYRGRLSWNGHRDFYGDRLGLIAQLEVVFADGHRQVVVTDESWSAGPSEVARRRPLRRPDDRRAAARRLLVASGSRAGGMGGGRGRAVRRAAAGAVRRTTRGPSREPAPGRDLDLAVGAYVGRLRAEPGRLAALHGARRGGPRDHAAARGGARGRRAGRPPAADRRGHRPARAQRWRRLLRADQDVPRVPLRGGQRLAGHPDRRLPRGRGRALRPAPDRPLLVLRRPAQPAARQHGLGPARQLPGRAQRLPATRRAARVDRRHRGVRALRGLPLRRRRLPPRLAGRPRTRAAGPGRAGAVRRPGRAEVRGTSDRVPAARDRRDLERRGRVGAVGAVAGVRRPAGARGPVRLHGRPPDPGRVAALAVGAVGHRLPVRRLAGPAGPARPAVRVAAPTAAWWPPPAPTGPPASWPSPPR